MILHAQSTVLWDLGDHGANAANLVEQEPKPEPEVLLLSQLLEEKLAMPLLKLNNVTSTHASSTVNNPIGLLGAYALQHAELEAEPEPEPQPYNQLLEEDNVELPWNKRLARWLNAQLIAFWEIGLYGQLALYHAEKEPNHEHVLLSLLLMKLEKPAMSPENKMYVNKSHAL
eukprot:TRINITY_DN52493_c0_g1_i1.p2 TRINITY_DN52493_c0_g1~~TRINITY_DN52493_c0_g1_i1.p2  ORF type:complete len:192 (-),score=7.83 TRINITY_DN52493_c0_g1_i1:45-560(-)